MGLFFDPNETKHTYKMINSTKIKINGFEYVLKASSYRAMFKFEELTGKSIADALTFKDQVVFIYCVLDAANKEFPYDLEGFIDILDENPDIITTFAELANDPKKK